MHNIQGKLDIKWMNLILKPIMSACLGQLSRTSRCYFFQTVEMTKEIMQSFRELLSETDWLDEETKNMAAQKLNAMTLRIGYPDFILNRQLLNERYKDVSNYMYKNISEISILKMNSR